MKLSIDEVQELLLIIEKNHLIFIGKQLGLEYLSKQDRKVLTRFGIDYTKLYQIQKDTLLNSLQLGLLADALQDQLKKVTYPELKSYISNGKYIPLSVRTRNALDNIKRQVYTSIKSLEGRIFKDVNQVLVDTDRKTQEEFLRKEQLEGVRDKKTVSQISHQIAEKTGDWSRDFDRIVQYNSQLAFEQGKSEQALKNGEDTLVYKVVYEKACKHCQEAYLNRDGSPKVFKISELIQNGSNIGRKIEELLPTISPIHPYCFINPLVRIYTSKGWVYIKDIQEGDEVLTHKGRFRKVTQLLRHTFNDKEDSIFNLEFSINKRKVNIKGVTGSHPFLTNRGWIEAKDLHENDILYNSTIKCRGCEEQVPLFLEDITLLSKEFCCLSCKAKFTNKKYWTEEKKEQHSKLLSKVMLDFYKENPQVIEKQKETLKIKFLTMSLEEKRRYTKNANKKVKELIETNKFNYSEEFLNPKRGKKSNTSLENKIKWVLEKMNLNFIEQYEITSNLKTKTGRNRKYFTDFYLPEYNLVLECNGDFYHNSEEQQKSDLNRALDIKRLIGAEVIVFTEEEIKNNLGECFLRLDRVLNNHKGNFNIQQCILVKKEQRKGQQLNNYKKNNPDNILYNFSVEEDESYIVNGIVTHNCRCELAEVPVGYIYNPKTSHFDIVDPNWKPKVKRKKIKVMIGDKEAWV